KEARISLDLKQGINMNIRLIQACLVLALLGALLHFTLVSAESATKEDVNELGNRVSGVLGLLVVGILLVVIVAIIMGVMNWSKY
ncbi:hypothetical protein, partial [Salmonella sp. s54412]|uniref:hypothetical protein n=1 Tax=Salmonella sp. s54412 TaxID=3160128 RepID=UPI003754EA88